MAVQTQEAPLRGSYERRKPRRRAAGFEYVGGSDYVLLLTVLALVTIGLLMVYSATYTLGYYLHENAHWFIQRQAEWAGLGLVTMLVFWRIPYATWQRWSVPIMALTVAALLVLLLLAKSVFGATRWLVNGSIQPAEAAKVAIIIYIAHWASSKDERIRKLDAGLIPFAVLIGLVSGLILLQPDFSTAALVALTSVTMFFIAGADLKQLVVTGLIGSTTLVLVATRASYRVDRIEAFLNPIDTQAGVGYQISQVLLAFARGGLKGEGLGSSRGNVPYLPAGHTDAIFAILGQELGLIACLLVLGLFLLLAHRGFRIAAAAPDAFGTILASGVTCWLIFQAIVNVAVVTSSIPFTGVPLPFISFGGSSLVTALAGVGLLLSVSATRRAQG
ncbi:MAG: putative lipid II flippase FtsW [Ardenticatenaceae bacterium]|nr:putative lipid II flippase FtsW [Ardenticatenaceae bacterium]HBY97785.1 putative lipid II flippase FtsW [Chloroflexota bacterium]